MSNQVELIKTGLHDYTDLGYTKPVLITEKNLHEIIANSYKRLQLTKEHTNEVIGDITGLKKDNDKLTGIPSTNINHKGKGYSPAINADYTKEYEDHIELIGAYFKDVGLTKSPRNGTLYNNVSDPEKNDPESNKEDNPNNEDKSTLKILIDSNNQLVKDQAIYQEKIKKLSKNSQEYKELEAKIEEITLEKEKIEKNLIQLTDKAKKYDKIQEKEYEKELKKFSKEDKKLKKIGETMTLEQLKALNNHVPENTPPKGVYENTPDYNHDGTKKPSKTKVITMKDYKEAINEVYPEQPHFDL